MTKESGKSIEGALNTDIPRDNDLQPHNSTTRSTFPIYKWYALRSQRKQISTRISKVESSTFDLDFHFPSRCEEKKKKENKGEERKEREAIGKKFERSFSIKISKEFTYIHDRC